MVLMAGLMEAVRTDSGMVVITGVALGSVMVVNAVEVNVADDVVVIICDPCSETSAELS